MPKPDKIASEALAWLRKLRYEQTEAAQEKRRQYRQTEEYKARERDRKRRDRQKKRDAKD